MIISWAPDDENETRATLIIALYPSDLLRVVSDHVVINVAEYAEGDAFDGLRIWLTGPAGGEALLRRAVELRDEGGDVRYRGRPGIPDDE